MEEEYVIKLELDTTSFNKQIEKVKENIQNLKDSKGSTFFNSLSKGTDIVMSKFKKLTSSLFNIKNMYALVSKASSAYLSEDTALANKLQAVWVRFGLFSRTNNISNSQCIDKRSKIHKYFYYSINWSRFII